MATEKSMTGLRRETMQPYLLCLNLNGMNTGAEPKILTLGWVNMIFDAQNSA